MWLLDARLPALCLLAIDSQTSCRMPFRSPSSPPSSPSHLSLDRGSIARKLAVERETYRTQPQHRNSHCLCTVVGGPAVCSPPPTASRPRCQLPPNCNVHIVHKFIGMTYIQYIHTPIALLWTIISQGDPDSFRLISQYHAAQAQHSTTQRRTHAIHSEDHPMPSHPMPSPQMCCH
jgi:hypothetical protein